MLRYAVLVMISCTTGAWAQQLPAEAPATSTLPAQQTAQTTVSMAEPLAGDHWTYEIRDETTGNISQTRENVITEVTPTEISVRYKVVGTPNDGFNIYDRSWNLLKSGAWRYSPNDGMGNRMPLETGKTWTFQSNDINAGAGNIWKRAGRSKVLGQENVTTRAGTFETFKIETSYTITKVKDPTRKEQISAQTWYAPAIGRWVKRSFMSQVERHLKINNTIELVEYGRKE
jgi:hypothetical protein